MKRLGFLFKQKKFKLQYYKLLLYSDTHTVDKMRTICLEHAKLGDKGTSTKLENMFFGCSPSQVLYNLEVGADVRYI